MIMLGKCKYDYFSKTDNRFINKICVPRGTTNNINIEHYTACDER